MRSSVPARLRTRSPLAAFTILCVSILALSGACLPAPDAMLVT